MHFAQLLLGVLGTQPIPSGSLCDVRRSVIGPFCCPVKVKVNCLLLDICGLHPQALKEGRNVKTSLPLTFNLTFHQDSGSSVPFDSSAWPCSLPGPGLRLPHSEKCLSCRFHLCVPCPLGWSGSRAVLRVSAGRSCMSNAEKGWQYQPAVLEGLVGALLPSKCLTCRLLSSLCCSPVLFPFHRSDEVPGVYRICPRGQIESLKLYTTGGFSGET